MKITNKTNTDKVVIYPFGPKEPFIIPANSAVVVEANAPNALTATYTYFALKDDIRAGNIVIEGGPL